MFNSAQLQKKWGPLLEAEAFVDQSFQQLDKVDQGPQQPHYHGFW